MTTTYYFDTSGLIKLYVREPGSLWIKQIFDAPNRTIMFSKIGIVESAAALAKRKRMNDLTASKQRLLFMKMLWDTTRRFQVFTLSDEIIYEAATLTQNHPLRGYDAVHLATALEINRNLLLNRLAPLTFVCADAKLHQAAKAEGLLTENPNNYP